MTKHIIWLKKERNINFVAQKLKEGELVIIPTDTIYGILTNCFSKKGIKKIYQIKRRDKNKPLLVLVSDFEMLKKLVLLKNLKIKESVLKKIMRKPVTVIFKARKNLPHAIVKNGKIAIRIPKNKLLQKIIKSANTPLVAPSANISGEKPKRFFWQIIKEFQNKVKYIFWKFIIWDIRPSTIIDCTGMEIKYIRIGRVKKI